MNFNSRNVCTGWKSNIDAIVSFFPGLCDFNESGTYSGPFLSINAESNKWDKSSYIKHFPKVTDDDIISIKGAGHAVHSDKPDETIELISNFLIKQDQN